MGGANQTLPLAIALIRKDGQTQQRIAISSQLVREYASLMRNGVIFPPIRVWWDGNDYWLADGFQRLAAAGETGLTEICAEIHEGTLADAQWDSFAANATHGKKRTAVEIERVISLALQHAHALQMSNVEIARHLCVSEASVRRYRKRQPGGSEEDGLRIVTRNGVTFQQRTSAIGKTSRRRRAKNRKDLSQELATMKAMGSDRIRPLLNLIGNWALGSVAPEACVETMERILDSASSRTRCAVGPRY